MLGQIGQAGKFDHGRRPAQYGNRALRVREEVLLDHLLVDKAGAVLPLHALWHAVNCSMQAQLSGIRIQFRMTWAFAVHIWGAVLLYRVLANKAGVVFPLHCLWHLGAT